MAKKRGKRRAHTVKSSPAPAQTERVKTERGKSVAAWCALIALILIILAVLEMVKDGLMDVGA